MSPVGKHMGFENNIEMLSLAFWQVLKLAGPVLAVALVIGLIIGIIQAATSINEMTLSFVPKVIIVILTIAVFSNYLILGLTDYFMFIFESGNTELIMNELSNFSQILPGMTLSGIVSIIGAIALSSLRIGFFIFHYLVTEQFLYKPE